jgi:heptosyltransferase-2
MATPALRALRENLPSARIVGVVRPYLISLLDGTSWLDAILPWEHRGRGRLWQGARLVRQLRGEKLEMALLLRATWSAGLAAWLGGARRVVGYARRGLGCLLTDPVQPLHQGRGSQPVSTVDEYLHLIEYLGYSIRSRSLFLATTPQDEAHADGVWRRLNLPPPEEVLLLNAGGAYGEAKHWPAEYCVSLALRVAEEFDLTTLVLCGPQEREIARAIERAASHPRVASLADEDVRFGTTKAIIRRSRMLVTTDSGPRHLAAALGTPTVVLFGPIDPGFSRNGQRESIELRVPLECSPCGRRRCPLGHHHCMRLLTVDQVLAAIARLLALPTSKVPLARPPAQAA